MAMDANRLGNAMATAIAGVVPGSDMTILTAMCVAQAAAIIAEIQGNAEVLPLPGLVAPAGGGPVSGEGSIT